jgi:hypothetical protein
MEGLVKEATKHVTADAPKPGELLDIVILAQYQTTRASSRPS